MAKNKNHNELSKEDYEHYLKSNKSGKKAHEFEKAVSESNFDSDALDGLESISEETAIADLKILESKLDGKRRTFGYLKIAAAISLLLISSAVIWQIVDQIKEPEQLSMSEDIEQKEKQKDSPSLPQNKEEFIPPKPNLEPAANIEVEKKEVESVNNKKIPSSKPTPIISKELETEDITPVIPEDESIRIATEGVTNEPSEAVHDETELDLIIEVADEEVLAETSLEELEDVDLEVQEERSLFIEEKVTANALPPATRKIAKRAARARSEAMPTASPTTSRRITGVVSDKELNEPIPGVSVIEKGTTNGTVTDFYGTYSLELEKPSSSELAFESIGFVTNETKIDNEEQVDVALDVDITSLSEVVVIGYSTESTEQLTGYLAPKPIGGKKSFDDYIAQNKTYPKTAKSESTSGRVVLKLSIDTYGVLSNIEITKSLGFGCDEEAVRLIKNWTGWEPAQLDGKPIASNIKVRIRFP